MAFIIRLLEQNAENGDQIVFSRDKVLCEQDLIRQEIVAKKNLTFLKREGDFIGGIMLVGKVCDKDLSFGALVEEHQESIVEKITAELFN